MTNLHNHLIIDGYEIVNDEGKVLMDSEGCPFQFLTHKEANKFLKSLKKNGINGKITKIKDNDS